MSFDSLSFRNPTHGKWEDGSDPAYKETGFENLRNPTNGEKL
jgi:hypothetical protein